MRIAQVMAGAAHGGAELFFERMTIALARAGETVLPIIRSEPARIARLRHAGLAPVSLRFGGTLDFFTTPRVAAVLRDFAPNVAIAWMSRAAAHAPRGDWTLVGRLGGYYDLKYFRRCDVLVGNTHGIVRWIVEQGFPSSCTYYLPNFVDDFAFTRPTDPAELGVPSGTPIVLALGRLHTVKGFDTLIHAMTRVPEAHLVIAGEGPERAALESLIGGLDIAARVHLVGWRRDIGGLLKAAAVFVSSSRHEPLGNMILEAFSSATPVVAAAAEGPREIIRDGVDGLLVPIDEACVMADAITRLIMDRALANGMAEAGRVRYEDDFAEPVVVSAWLSLFGKLVHSCAG